MRILRIFAGLLLLTAPAWSAGGAPVRSSAKAAAQPARSDLEIEKTIRAKLAKSKISEDKFQVHVQGGIATLEGKTDVIQHKGVATRLAKSSGAIVVNNHIQISDARARRPRKTSKPAGAGRKSGAASRVRSAESPVIRRF